MKNYPSKEQMTVDYIFSILYTMKLRPITATTNFKNGFEVSK